MAITKFKAVITDRVLPSIAPERAVLNKAGIEPVIAPLQDEDSLARTVEDADAIMFCFAQVGERVLKAANRCVVASRYGIGVDNIDVPLCTELGIVVTNVPDYCISEVADHAIGMIIALNRRFLPHDRAVKLGRLDSLSLNEPVKRSSDSTLGIVGFGRIGRAVANLAKSFNMSIVMHDPLINAGETVDGARSMSLDELLRVSDFVTVHVPLTPQNRGMIGTKQIAMMKDSAVIVNCARGGVVDEGALADGLESGKLGGVGLDVLETMEPEANERLFAQPNFIATPHTAFFSESSSAELQRRTAEEVVRVVRAQRPENIVNPEVLGSSRAGI